ncbi:histidine kinase [Chondrocystis sp. NIES-4102]|nr:histidine kinase [Chondrocystis sp. NIES-4102]
MQETRTNILMWYALLMFFFIAVSLPTIRQRLYSGVDTRVRGELAEEVEEFRKALVAELFAPAPLFEQPPVNALEARYAKLNNLFDNYIEKELLEDDTYLISIVNGQFYKASSLALPPGMEADSKLMKYWASLETEKNGEQRMADPNIGNIIYTVIPIKTETETLGAFVVVHATEGERKEAIEAMRIVTQVKIIALCLALILAWFVAGKVLAPLRTLITTARSISDTDLSKRLPIKGNGELAELAITFNEMMERLQTSFTTQRNFINDAGHELRTPITIIRGHLELMGDDPQEQQETIELVLDELDRMNRLVSDLVLLAKSENPNFLKIEKVDIASLTEEVLVKIKALGERNWQLDCVANGTVTVDRQRLTQALVNLAQNATQHTVEENTIAIGSAIARGEVHFWIRDTGEGIDPSDQKRIFERFARVSGSRRRSEGSGLGLAIVKAIAEAHGGMIRLDSNLGMGSKFTIVLPLEAKPKLPTITVSRE